MFLGFNCVLSQIKSSVESSRSKTVFGFDLVSERGSRYPCLGFMFKLKSISEKQYFDLKQVCVSSV